MCTLPSPSRVLTEHVVLPHEKLYLGHLPDADRYYKSFMHRDVINFNVVTKSVFYDFTAAILSKRHASPP